MTTPINNTEYIAHELCTFLRDNVLATEINLTPESDLSDIGIDSFSLMEMILFIERRFGLVLPPESLTTENIVSVNALSQCCAILLNPTDV